jgi:hypothetical protein
MTTPCSEPAAHVALVFARRGAGWVRVRTDAAGRYRVRLRPGSYVVRVARIQRIQPDVVVVRVPRRVDFMIDTGIR